MAGKAQQLSWCPMVMGPRPLSLGISIESSAWKGSQPTILKVSFHGPTSASRAPCPEVPRLIGREGCPMRSLPACCRALRQVENESPGTNVDCCSRTTDCQRNNVSRAGKLQMLMARSLSADKVEVRASVSILDRKWIQIKTMVPYFS